MAPDPSTARARRGPRACAACRPRTPTPVPRPLTLPTPSRAPPRNTAARVDAHRRTAADPCPPCPSVSLSLSPWSPARRIPPPTHAQTHTHAPQPTQTPRARETQTASSLAPRPSSSPPSPARAVWRARARPPRSAPRPHFAARSPRNCRAPAPIGAHPRRAFRAARFATAPRRKNGTGGTRARGARTRGAEGAPRGPPNPNPQKPKRMRSDAPLAASVDPNTLQNPNDPACPPMKIRAAGATRARADAIRVYVYLGSVKSEKGGHFECDLERCGVRV